MSQSEDILDKEMERRVAPALAGTWPVVPAGPLDDAARHRVAAWLGVDYRLVTELEEAGLPIVLTWKRDEQEAIRVVEAMQKHQLPVTVGERVRISAVGPVLTALLVALASLPLLVPALLVGVLGLLFEPDLWIQLSAWVVAGTWPALVWASYSRKGRARLRREAIDRSCLKIQDRLGQVEHLDRTANELVLRVRRLRRFVLTSTLPEAVETDVLAGLEGLEHQIAQIDEDRRKVRRALDSEGAERIRGRLSAGGAQPEAAVADLRAMEELSVGLDGALTRVEEEMDALELALVRLSTHEAAPTAAELDQLIVRTRSAQDAGEELARIHKRVGAARVRER